MCCVCVFERLKSIKSLVSKIFLMFMKEVFARQACIYLIKNAVKLWNITN